MAVALRELRRALRSPPLVVLELCGFALAIAVTTIVPQPGEDPGAKAVPELLGPAVGALGLDRVFSTGWFAGLTAIAAASLAVVTWDQWRRVARRWGQPLREASFSSAPYRRELERGRGGVGRTRVESRGRIAELGAPVFHLGLLLVVIAGLVRALFGADAGVDVYEGHELDASASAYDAHWKGALASGFELEQPIVIREIREEWHPSGSVASVTVTAEPSRGSAGPVTFGINQPLELGDERLYASSVLGVAVIAALETGGTVSHTAFLLGREDDGIYRTRGRVPGGLELRLAGARQDGGEPSPVVEARVLRDGVLLDVARLAPGDELSWPGGRFVLLDVRRWLRLHGSRDPSVWIAFLGIGVIIAGAVFMFAVVRVDRAVLVEGDKVVVAMRPHRFVPLYAEAFERMVREEAERA